MAIPLTPGANLDLDDAGQTKPALATNPKSEEHGDACLMARIAAGDRRAYTELVNSRLDAILSYARRYTRNQADAEDVTQETFLRLWRKAGEWRDQENNGARASVTAWLYRIAYNLCVDLYRRKSMGEIAREDDWPGRDDDRPEHALIRDERLQAVETALRQLPERQYSAIALCTYQGLSNREAADVLGVGVDALESLLARGRRRLRELLLEKQD